MNYISTTNICEIYDVSRDFFQRRIQSGVFIKNEHYIKKSNTIRWDLKAVERWWRGANMSSYEYEDILNKILPN